MMARSGSIRVHDGITFATAALACLVIVFLAGCVPPGGYRQQGIPGDTTGGADITRVLGVRIHGVGDEGAPPILRLAEPGKAAAGDALTLTFEMISSQMPNPQLILIHCDASWQPTQSIFIQDNFRLRTSDFHIERAPIAARFYDYRLSITFPSPDNRIELRHSGNYLARVVDYYNNEQVLAETRFFVFEQKAAVDMDIYSDFFQSAQASSLSHGLKIRVESEPSNDLFAAQPKGVHLYKSGEWFRPIVAGEGSYMDERGRGEPRTLWNSSFGGKTVAEFSNIAAGNEHRPLDLTDLIQYPPTNAALSTPLSDLPRSGAANPDNNGRIPPRFVSTSDDDYVVFEFKLDLAGYQANEDIFVVGTFNNWLPTPEWQLHFDEASGFYIARGLIRRAFHEYEYLAGTWDADAGVLRNAESTLLEGNSSYATALYYAFVFYRDPTAGGYDRLIGVNASWSGAGQ